MSTCTATTQKGTQCTRHSLDGETYCRQHLNISNAPPKEKKAKKASPKTPPKKEPKKPAPKKTSPKTPPKKATPKSPPKKEPKKAPPKKEPKKAPPKKDATKKKLSYESSSSSSDSSVPARALQRRGKK